mmetsp:Transcript_33896/g.89838  ORF Transcript_33896/g.89838 Transcript_33896/m.89838 type:complete len:278 (+) Transcript_33896:3463-4296(+)
MALLEQRLGDAPERHLARLPVLQRVHDVERVEAGVGDGLRDLLPPGGLAHPQPRHRALRDEVGELGKHRASLPLESLLRLLGLLHAGVRILVGAAARAFPATAAALAPDVLRRLLQHPLSGPAQEEDRDLGGIACIAAGGLLLLQVLVLRGGRLRLEALGLRRDLPGRVREEVHDAGLDAVVHARPGLEEGEEQREGLVLGEVKAARLHQAADERVQRRADFIGRPIIHGRLVRGPEAAGIGGLGEELLRLEGEVEVPHPARASARRQGELQERGIP